MQLEEAVHLERRLVGAFTLSYRRSAERRRGCSRVSPVCCTSQVASTLFTTNGLAVIVSRAGS